MKNDYLWMDSRFLIGLLFLRFFYEMAKTPALLRV